MNSNQSTSMLRMGILIEGGMIMLALALGFLNLFDPAQPLWDLPELPWFRLSAYGVLATLPLVGYFLMLEVWSPSFYRPMQEFVDQSLKPMFRDSSILELAIISLLAGVGEELLFRWCLQGGTTMLLQPIIGGVAALVVSLLVVNVVFGVCHWVNSTYFVFALLAGIYLGLVMWLSGSWVVAAIAHTLFDFIALLYLKKSRSGVAETQLQPQT